MSILPTTGLPTKTLDRERICELRGKKVLVDMSLNLDIFYLLHLTILERNLTEMANYSVKGDVLFALRLIR